VIAPFIKSLQQLDNMAVLNITLIILLILGSLLLITTKKTIKKQQQALRLKSESRLKSVQATLKLEANRKIKEQTQLEYEAIKENQQRLLDDLKEKQQLNKQQKQQQALKEEARLKEQQKQLEYQETLKEKQRLNMRQRELENTALKEKQQAFHEALIKKQKLNKQSQSFKGAELNLVKAIAEPSIPLVPPAASNEEIKTSSHQNRLEQLIGNTYEINYLDSKKELKLRQVTIKKTELKNEVIYIKTYCHLSKAPRTFRLDRIIGGMTDVQTGEIIDPYVL
jgi:flagellar biosynthesis GTPase FlhF